MSTTLTMTDKEKLEKIQSLADKMYTSMQNLTTDTTSIRKAMNEYHQFIIQHLNNEEPVSEDLEEAADNFCESITEKCHMLPDMKIIAFHTFKAGAQWHKQQMMKDAVDVKILPANLEETEFCLDVYDEVKAITKLVKENSLKIEDQVKLIIVKED